MKRTPLVGFPITKARATIEAVASNIDDAATGQQNRRKDVIVKPLADVGKPHDVPPVDDDDLLQATRDICISVFSFIIYHSVCIVL